MQQFSTQFKAEYIDYNLKSTNKEVNKSRSAGMAFALNPWDNFTQNQH